MTEFLNQVICGYFGPVILIAIILIGIGAMTSKDVLGLAKDFMKLAFDVFVMIFMLVKEVLKVLVKLLTAILTSISDAIEHYNALRRLKLQQQQQMQQNQQPQPANTATANVQFSFTQQSTSPPGASETPVQPPASGEERPVNPLNQQPDIQIIRTEEEED